MKVSTDACVQGAWTPVDESVKHVLDIGTGTGLLSLMLAQRNLQIHIDAVELDEDAAQQALQNAALSPWSKRINIIQADARAYVTTQQYDMVICNPPFFNNSLLGDTRSRNTARHTLSLSYTDLLGILSRALTDNGYASILLPVTEHEEWTAILEKNNWYVHRRLLIQPKADSKPNRVVSICSRKECEGVVEEKLIIYSRQSEYTQEATELLKPFYLKL